MSLDKYFRINQKIQLRPLGEEPGPKIETLSAYLRECGSGFCDLALPYRSPPGEEFPFEEQMRLELLGEAMGMGVRAVGCFERQLDTEIIRLRMEPDLQMFQRRQHRRLDAKIGLRFTRGEGTLRSFREQWQKNVRLLELPANLAKLQGLPKAQANLSAGGIRLPLKPPVTPADLFMLFLEIEPQGAPICILAEVIWTGEELPDGRIPAGMHYVNILQQDQKRIDQYVLQSAAATEAAPEPDEAS